MFVNRSCWYSVTCLFYTLQVGIHILIFFLTNLAKGNMSFCHHLVSVVCHPFTFHILIFSSENPRFFRNQPIRNKNCLWCPCLLTDRDKISNLYRGPSIDTSYQVSVHFGPLYRLHILSRSINKHGRNRQFLFLIGRF
jgi:hypothetical protein